MTIFEATGPVVIDVIAAAQESHSPICGGTLADGGPPCVLPPAHRGMDHYRPDPETTSQERLVELMQCIAEERRAWAKHGAGLLRAAAELVRDHGLEDDAAAIAAAADGLERRASVFREPQDEASHRL